MNFLQQIMAKFQQFMVGRYGSDSFTLFLTISGLVCSILSNFKPLGFLYLVSIILIFTVFSVLFHEIMRQEEKSLTGI